MTEIKDRIAAASGPEEPSGPPALGLVGWLRWTWRQLTSMKTALVLLFLLALGAVPGSLIPQTAIDPVKVSDFFDRAPEARPVLRQARPVRRLQVRVVLGDLPAAVHLADRLRGAAAVRST